MEGHTEGMKGSLAENQARIPIEVLPPECSITQSLTISFVCLQLSSAKLGLARNSSISEGEKQVMSGVIELGLNFEANDIKGMI